MEHEKRDHTPPPTVEQILTRIAQDGVITSARAAKAGVTSRVLERRATNGFLSRVGTGVYVLAGAELSGRTAERAALAATRSPAICLWSAFAAHIGGPTPPRVHVMVRYPAQFKRTRWFTAHPTRRLADDELTTRNGLAITTMPRTIRDFAAFLPSREWADLQLTEYVEQALIKRRLTLKKLEATIRAEQAQQVRTRLERALAHQQGSDPATFRSIGEVWLRDLLVRRSLPMAQFNVRAAGGYLAEADAWWPDIPFIIEFDGFAHHHTRTRHDADRRRDRRALRAGIPTLRITKTDFDEDLPQLEADVEWFLTGQSATRAAR